MHPNRVVRQTVAAKPARDLGAELRADGAVHVPNRQVDLDRLALFQRWRRASDELDVERVFEAVLLRSDASP